MGAFFFALIGLLCVAGGKAYNSANTKLSNREYDETDHIKNTTYKNLRINFGVRDAEVQNEFSKLDIAEITDMLGEDFSYITGRDCGTDYFAKAMEAASANKYKNPIMDTILYLWLAHHGVIDKKFASTYSNKLYSLSVYIPEHEAQTPTSIFNNEYDRKVEIEEQNKVIRIKTLQRIEYNLRKKYPDLRFVFPTEYTAYNKHTEKDVHKLYFQLKHEMLQSSWNYTIRGWKDNETDPNINEAQRLELTHAAQIAKSESEKKKYFRVARSVRFINLAFIVLTLFLLFVIGCDFRFRFELDKWEENYLNEYLNQTTENFISDNKRKTGFDTLTYSKGKLSKEYNIVDIGYEAVGETLYIYPVVEFRCEANLTNTNEDRWTRYYAEQALGELFENTTESISDVSSLPYYECAVIKYNPYIIFTDGTKTNVSHSYNSGVPEVYSSLYSKYAVCLFVFLIANVIKQYLSVKYDVCKSDPSKIQKESKIFKT